VTEENGRIHNQAADLLSAYIDDEVTADERALVETHLATCTACAQGLATLRQTVALLGQLPQVVAPRPFTLRESDVRPAQRPARPAWWRLPWAQGLVAAAAMLLCVVIVGGVLLLRGPGRVGAPGGPAPVAMQAPAATEVAAEKMVVETVEEAEKVVGVEKEVQKAAEPAAPPLAAEEPTAEFGMLQEVPAEAPQNAGEALADEGKISPTMAPARVAPTPMPMPSATPAPAEGLSAAPSPAPTLLEVEDLALEIEPGVIHVSGRLPLPEGRKLLADLWREGQPTEWAMPESQQATVKGDGQFSLTLQAQAETPDFDLFAVEPANYEIRIRLVDPPEPIEARIPFDTYGPPGPPPTSSP
jgi:hypothetical protein